MSCDICGSIPDDITIKYIIPEIAEYYKKNGINNICVECLALAELHLIHMCYPDDLPLLINYNFTVVQSDDYYKWRMDHNGARDSSVFDFGLEKIKNIVARVKKEL